MNSQSTINFSDTLAQTPSDQYRQASQRSRRAGKDARLVVEKARAKVVHSELVWQRAQERYRQLELRLQTLQTNLRNTSL